jgi:hypothetical protein
MTFAAPWILFALPALPVLWWLLRVTPPAPKREAFPAIRLLAGLDRTEETSARTPWWLLALRVAAAALIIVGLARPVLDHGEKLPGTGPVLLAMDDGWASAADWSRRVQAADAVLDRAEQAGRPAVLLSTAPNEDASQPKPTPAMPVPDLRARLAALRPKPWGADHAATAAVLNAWRHPGAGIVYLSDGLAEPGDAAFAAALRRIGPVSEIRDEVPTTRVLLPPRSEPDALIARVWQAPHPGASPDAVVLAQSGDGRTLARVTVKFPPDAMAAAGTIGTAPIKLPPEVRNQLTRLVLEGPASAASVVMLDERWRRRPVGLLAGDMAGSESPLIGQLYYLRRALGPFTEVREGDLKTLLARDLSVLVLADRVVADGPETEALTRFVEHGGVLVRFAGPRTAEHPDSLLPVHLLDGERQLGGSLSWGKPEHLAPFPPNSPFAGLAVPNEVQVTRQVLAEPSADLAAHSWATLTDGTPLVTAATRGAGRIVLFHVTANADWSNLPLSGLYVDMLRRLVALSAGVTRVADNTVLPPAETLDGFGQLGTPPQAATGLIASAFASTPVSPRHPPGLYGPENGRQALNLSAALPPLRAAPVLAGARDIRLGGVSPERALGPPLIAIALALLAIDLILSLLLRGLLRWRPGLAAGAALLVLMSLPAHAAESDIDRWPALAVHLAYIATGNDQVDQISRTGLAGLADYVNQRTAATIADPVAVAPGKDDLSFYPLLYWPIVPDAALPSAAALAALNSYMANGGIILIDTRDGGSGADFNPGAEAALKRLGKELAIPPLAPLTIDHVLARSFYLLHEFPGRYEGDTVWVQRDQDRANDSVSPVIIGGNDWAAAWAVDANGHNPYAVIPGGARQRTLAYRFGLNLVMYALTGNYKGDQVHVPAILERLGQ